MTQIKIKRVYEDPEAEDGYSVLVGIRFNICMIYKKI